MSKLLIASGNGRIYSYDTDTQDNKCVFFNPNPNEWFMGLAKYKDKIVVSSTFGVHLMEWRNDELFCLCSIANVPKINPRFHHIRVIGDKVFAAASAANAIFIMKIVDNTFEFVATVEIKDTKSITNFDNVTSVIYDKHKFFILLNSLGEHFHRSRYVVLSNSFKLLRYTDFGWRAHGLTIVDNVMYAVCNWDCEGNPGGLVVEKDIKLGWSKDHYISDISISKDSVFLVGHTTSETDDGKSTVSGGIIFHAGRDFRIKHSDFLKGLGQFRGCLLLDEVDLAKDESLFNTDTITIKNYKEHNVTVRLQGNF